jgi:D-3-phosphoglycerate dehydrogenase
VAEFTIAAILAETRLIRAGHESLRQGVWRGDLYRFDKIDAELSEMTVGLIGYGHIGTKVVRLLKPFGCRILVCDPYVPLSAEDREDDVEQVDLDTLLKRSDVVSLHARVTEETKGFLAAPQFARMKPGAYFINTRADGELRPLQALKSRHVRGAMLETFWLEPPPVDSPLLKLDNVTLTPHIAGASTTIVRIAARMIAEEIRRHGAGEPPLNPC